MPVFDLEHLLRKPRIEAPREEFLSPPPPEEKPTALPDPETPPAPTPGPEDVLLEEAAHLQELLDLLQETAEPVSVPVDPADRELLGESLTGDDYLNALRDRHPKARRTRDAFERGLLNQTGCGPSLSWPLLAAPTLLGLRDSLMGAAQALQGSLLNAAEFPATGAAGVPKAVPSPGVQQVNAALVRDSRAYRMKFAQAVGTFTSDLSGPVLECLVEHVAGAPTASLRPQLQELRDLLSGIKQALCLAMVLRMMEFSQVRQALMRLLETVAMELFMKLLSQLINQAEQAVLTPLLQKLAAAGRDTDRKCDLLSLVGDATATALTETLFATVYTLTSHYTEVLSDILIEQERRRDLALDELQILGERNTLGRWILHLDQAILLLDQLQSQLGSLESAGRLLRGFAAARLASAPSRLYDRLAAHPGYRDALSLNLDFRSPVFTHVS